MKVPTLTRKERSVRIGHPQKQVRATWQLRRIGAWSGFQVTPDLRPGLSYVAPIRLAALAQGRLYGA